MKEKAIIAIVVILCISLAAIGGAMSSSLHFYTIKKTAVETDIVDLGTFTFYEGETKLIDNNLSINLVSVESTYHTDINGFATVYIRYNGTGTTMILGNTGFRTIHDMTERKWYGDYGLSADTTTDSAAEINIVKKVNVEYTYNDTELRI